MRTWALLLAAAVLLGAAPPAAGIGCAAGSCPGMAPAHRVAALSAPLDCCRVRSEREPAAPARLLPPQPVAAAPALDELPRALDLRPEPRLVPASSAPVRAGPPLYTLLSTLLI